MMKGIMVYDPTAHNRTVSASGGSSRLGHCATLHSHASFHPHFCKIVLFGSYARGNSTEKSDIDLLIIKKGLKNGRKMNNLLYKAFFENKIGIPVDLISIDYNKYIELNNDIGYIYKTIKEQGKIIYGAL